MQIDRNRSGIALGAGLVIALAVFSLCPALDPAVSSFFYAGGQGFPAAASDLIETIRTLFWRLSDLTFLASVAGLALSLALRRRIAGLGKWGWSFIVSLYLLAPVLLVNLILKRHWGRARPADTDLFGGTAHFTPFWRPANECLSNCSFVSGEVAGSTATAVALLVIAPGLSHILGRVGLIVWRVLAVLLPFAVMLQRVVSGRHFASDVVFALLFTLAVAWLLSPLLCRDKTARNAP